MYDNNKDGGFCKVLQSCSAPDKADSPCPAVSVSPAMVPLRNSQLPLKLERYLGQSSNADAPSISMWAQGVGVYMGASGYPVPKCWSMLPPTTKFATFDTFQAEFRVKIFNMSWAPRRVTLTQLWLAGPEDLLEYEFYARTEDQYRRSNHRKSLLHPELDGWLFGLFHSLLGRCNIQPLTSWLPRSPYSLKSNITWCRFEILHAHPKTTDQSKMSESIINTPNMISPLQQVTVGNGIFCRIHSHLQHVEQRAHQTRDGACVEGSLVPAHPRNVIELPQQIRQLCR